MKRLSLLSTAVLAVIFALPAHAGGEKHPAAPQESAPVAPQAPARDEPAAGSTWIENKTGMEFVWIPSGCFQMGSSAGEARAQPVHRVCVKGFYLGKYEVTQAQYQQVMGKNPSYFQGANNPVEQVSWDDTQNFMEEIRYTTTSNKLRLPSEAEWEYACRAGGQHETYCGGGRVDRFAWYNENSGKTTHPVGQLAANAFGLYDMNGNVWEWVQDVSYTSYQGAPTDGSAWEGSGEMRVLRGGSWFGSPQNGRAASRGNNSPAVRNSSIGFRLARTLP